MYLLDFHTPHVFDTRNPDNALKRYDESFNNLCANMETNGTTGAKDLMTFEFFARVDFYEKRYEAMKKARK